MQGIYTYIPETNHIPMEYSVAGILLLLFMVLISLAPVLDLLYVYISTFRSMCAVPNMVVFCSYYYYYYYYNCYYYSSLRNQVVLQTKQPFCWARHECAVMVVRSYHLIQQLQFFICNRIHWFENRNDMMGVINVHRYATDGACRAVYSTMPT